DITDEHDVAVPGVRPQPDGSVNVDGAVPIRDLNRVMDWNLPDEEATTIAGLVIHEARLIPEPGQSFTFHGFRFRVLRRERNRLTALRITPVTRLATRMQAPRSRLSRRSGSRFAAKDVRQSSWTWSGSSPAPVATCSARCARRRAPRRASCDACSCRAGRACA